MSDNNIDFFKNYQGQNVSVIFDDTSYEMMLDEVAEQTHKSIDGSEQASSFSLFFVSEDERSIVQGVYSLKFGEQYKDIFIVPVGTEKGRSTYQAVFN